MTRSEELEAALRGSPTVMRVLEHARSLDLADWRLVSGSVYQTAWNRLTGRDPDYGVKDFDLVYFDPDTSWDAEDAAIQRAAAHFPPDLAPRVEVRNQARVHLWFEGKFGEPYAPLANTDESLSRYVAPAFAVGVRLEPDDRIDIAAPFGLEDLFAMRLRPNPQRQVSLTGFDRAAASLNARWPEVEILRP
jgi:uncharacterized protein